MSCSRISRLTGSGLLLLAAVVFGAGCKDDLGRPTQAEVTLRFSAENQSIVRGATVLVDGLTITDSLSSSELRLSLEEGNHTVIVRKDCVGVTPSETLTVAVEGGSPRTLDFRLLQLSGLQVLSEPAGLPVYLNGQTTGQVTPASFACLPPGSHEVAVSGQLGFLAEGDTLKTVVLGEGTATVRFDLTLAPRPQARGVLFEIFTSTYCPFCKPADLVAEELALDPAFATDQLSVVQLHLYWTGLDPFFNQELGDRMIFYRIVESTSPHAFFNGMDKVTGSLDPNLKATYRSKILNTYGQSGKVGLYWAGPRIEGSLVKARLRYVAIDDLSGYGWPELRIIYAKDRMRFKEPQASDPQYNPNQLEWIQGARDFMDPIALVDSARVAPGSVLDVDVTFDLDLDIVPDYIDWSSGDLRLVAFVQDNPTKEILQCRQVHLHRP